jgi:hypothetical protein
VPLAQSCIRFAEARDSFAEAHAIHEEARVRIGRPCNGLDEARMRIVRACVALEEARLRIKRACDRVEEARRPTGRAGDGAEEARVLPERKQWIGC